MAVDSVHRPASILAVLVLDCDEAASPAARLRVEREIPVMVRDEHAYARFAREMVSERFAKPEQVKRFAILDRDLTQDAGELTPTQKAKRAVVHERFRDVIDSLYG